MMSKKFNIYFLLIILYSFLLVGCSLFNYSEKIEEKQNNVKQVKVEEKNKVVTEISEDVIEHKEDTVRIDKSEYKLTMFKDGKLVLEAKCAVGKNPGQKTKRGDLKTPVGTFYVDEIIDSSYWTHNFGDGKGEIEGAYGPWFISLDTMPISKGEWDGIGIHGTHDNASLGTMASEGCIRLSNTDIEKLKSLVKVGTKVIIQE